MKILRVGARGSRLSVWQAEFAIDRLRRHGVSAQLCILSSSGDRDQDSPIEELPGDAPFVDDLQQALRAGEIDAAVHSLKDMAVEGPDDLLVPAILPRGSITESLVSKDGVTFRDLPRGAIVGTSSSRRKVQLLYLRPDIVCKPIRGPVDDRVRQVRGGAFDAAILATVGLERLGLSNQIAETFALKAFAPAAGQGAIAVQVRVNDRDAQSRLRPLDDFSTRVSTTAELSAQRRLEHADTLVAGWAETHQAFLTLNLRVLSRSGRPPVDVLGSGVDPERVASEACDRALDAIAGMAGAR
jgi:hydroxymethylbilane synthase